MARLTPTSNCLWLIPTVGLLLNAGCGIATQPHKALRTDNFGHYVASQPCMASCVDLQPYCAKSLPAEPALSCYFDCDGYCAKPLPYAPHATCMTACDNYRAKPLPFTGYPSAICGCASHKPLTMAAHPTPATAQYCDQFPSH